jgi:hypothetical protein
MPSQGFNKTSVTRLARVRSADSPLSQRSFDCQIADHSHVSGQLCGRGQVRQFDFSGLIASAKCAESNAGLPNLHRFVFEFCMNMVAG